MHIGIAGHIATEYVNGFLTSDLTGMPKGYPGAPLTGVLIGELLKQGHKVSAFTTDPSLYAKGEVVKATGPNFDFYVCPARPRAWRFNQYRLGRAVDCFAFEREQLFNIMSRVSPDIIHAHWTYEFALSTIKTGLPHLITCHDAPAVVLQYTRSPYRAIRYLMARQVFRKGKHFTAVSKYMADAVQHYTPQPIDVVPNPLADYVLSTGRIRGRGDTKRIGLVCNGWDARKNPKPSLQGFARLLNVYPDAELHLFGNGYGDNEDAQQWCQKQGLLTGMVFHGVMPHRQLISRLNDMDLFLHPALEESFGVVVAEAMALGLPIVAGQHSGAVPWVVGADLDSRCSAVLTDVSNPIAIADSIEKAFDENYSERSESGYVRARQMFSAGVVIDTYLELYREILREPTGGIV